MKYFSFIVLFIHLSCNGPEHKDHNSKGEEYTCPMHPEIIRDQPGSCPICGMDLVKRAGGAAQKIYTCPMHPEIIRDQPGSCPVCGMDLVEKPTEGGGLQDTSLQLLLKPTDQYVISQMKTIRIIKKEMPVLINVTGVITYDPELIHSVSARVAGRIEKLYVKYRFQPVDKGDKLMEIYSRELVTEQQNYVYLLEHDAANPSIIAASESKLQLLGLTAEQILALKSSRQVQQSVSVYSKYTGHLHDEQSMQEKDVMNPSATKQQELAVHEGMYVRKGQTVFNIYSTDKVWAILNVSAEKQSLLEKNMSIRLSVDGVEDSITARSGFIEPVMRQEDRTTAVRVYLDNPDNNLKIGAIARGVITGKNEEGFYLPSSAVLNLGVKNVVFVMREKLFEAREVRLGMRNNGWVRITSGLDSTDLVAENAQLLMDSEAFVKTNKE